MTTSTDEALMTPSSHYKTSPLILNVDDNESMRYVRRDILSRAGYQVIDAETGEEALRLAESQRPDVILLDVRLPDIDGFEVCRRLKSDLHTSHIMVLQVSAAGPSAVDAADRGDDSADGYLIEPIDPLELLATVKVLLRFADRKKDSRRLTRHMRTVEKMVPYRAIFANATEGIAIIDKELRYIEQNLAHRVILGYTNEELIGRTPVLHLGEEIFQRMAKELTDTGRFQGELRSRRKDGRWIDIALSAFGIYDDNGEVLCYVGMKRDITARTRQEAALKESAARLAAIFNQSTAGIAQTDLTGRFMLVNDRYCEITGRTRETLLTLHMQDITHPDDLPVNVERFQALAEDRGGNFVVEKRYVKPDGSIVWVHNEVSAIRDVTGRIQYINAVVADITENRTTEHFIRRITDLAPSNLYVYDLEGRRYVWGNREMFAALGYHRDRIETAGTRLDTALHPDDWPRYQAHAEQLHRLADGDIAEFEYRLRHADGSYRWWHTRETVFKRSSDGRAMQIAGSALDITDRKQTEDAFRHSEQRLRLATEAAAIGIWEWNATTNEVLWDTQMFRIYGAAPTPNGVVPYSLWSEAVLPEDLPEQERILRDTVQRRGSSTRAFRIRRYHDGEERHIEAVDTVRLNDRGETEWVVGTNIDVTERAWAEEGLRESEARFRNMADHAPVMIWVTEGDGHCSFLSQSWYRFTGQTPETGLGFGWLEATHPTDRAPTEQLFREANANRKSFRAEYRLKRHDGEYRWMIDSAEPRLSSAGDFLGYIGSVIDITERKEAEDALRAAHTTFRHLVEQSPFGVYAVDEDFRLVQVSAGAQKVFENVQPLLGRDFSEVLRQIWPEPFASEALARFRHTLATGEPYHAPGTLARRRDSGELETYDWRIERLKLPDGRFGVVCHFYDLTERQRYETALTESEEQWRLALESADMGSWDVDLRTGKALWNRRHAQLQGYDEGGPHSIDQWRERVHPDDLDRVLAAAEQAKRERTPFVVEHRVCMPDTAKERWLSLYGRFTYDDAGEPVRFSGVSFDITDRKQGEAERELRARQQQALASLGQAALGERDLQTIFDLAVECLVRTLQVELCKVLELLPSGRDVLLRAGVGWREGLVGHATVGTGLDSQAGYTLATNTPVIVEDLRKETRFSGPPLLHNHGVVSGISCIILDAGNRPWGVLGAHTTSPRRFTEDDVAFLQSVANVLAGAIQREQAEHEAARLAAIVRSSEDAIIGQDRGGVITSWNQGAERLYGYTAAEVIGRPISMLVPSERQGEEQELMSSILNGEWIDHYETVRRRKDGRVFDVSLTISPIHDLHGEIVGVSKIARDITEQKRVETALRESEARFRTLADHMSQFAWMADETGALFWYNQRWFDYTGTTLEEMQGWGWQAVHHPDYLPRVLRSWRQALETGADWEDTFPLRGHDGQYRWFLSRAVPIRNAEGRLVRWFGTNTDITDLREAEQAQAHLAAIVTSSDDAIISTDLTGRITSWNRGAERLFEYTEREALGQSVSLLMPKGRKQEEPELLEPIRSGLSIEHYETVWRRKDDTPLDISLTVSPIKDERGRVIGASQVARDITARKRQEEELRRWKDELEVRVRERTSELLATQDRLMAVTAQLSLTEQRERRKLARDLHDYLAQMLVVGHMKAKMLKPQITPASSGSALVQELDQVFQQALTYTRTLIAELSPPSLHEAGLPAALQWLGERFAKDGLRVRVHAPCATVPLSEEQAVVVFQAVRELLFNVLKHAGVDLATVTVTREDDMLRVAVADQGRGSSLETLHGSMKPGHLGLVSVRERFQAMGGRVEVASAVGRGTTVTLVLPLVSSAETTVLSPAAGQRADLPLTTPHVSEHQTNTLIRVLLVDDHRLVRQGLREIVAADDRLRVVGEAGTGEEALMLVANLRPDVVLTDINLPDMNGIEATTRCKQLRPQMVVLGLSVHTDESIKDRMRAAGAETVLSKECAAEELTAAIVKIYDERIVSGRVPRVSD